MDKKPKILIVDDENENLINFKILYRKVFDVLTAISAKAALEILEEEKVEVVVSDHLMPEMSGIELFEILAEKKPQIPRILLSGYVELNVVLDAVNRGRVFQYVNKPYDPEFLKASINKAIEMQNLRQQNIGLSNDLEIQKKKYESLFNEASDGLLVGVYPGEIIDANKKMCEITGYDKAELIGQNISFLFDKEELERKPFRYDLVDLQETIILERFLKRKDGKSVEVEMSTNKQPDGRLQAIFRDITNRKKVEQQIRENEERLSHALEASNEGIWEWNLITNETYYSPTWYEMLGYEASEFPPTFDTWKDLCNPEDCEKTLGIIKGMLDSGGNFYEAPFRMRQKDGKWRWILGKGKVKERDKEGNVIMLIGSNTDIHKIKIIEEELKFKSSFEHIFFKISNSFINMPYSEIDEGINSALNEIAVFAKTDYAIIFKKEDQTFNFQISHCSPSDKNLERFPEPLRYNDHLWFLDEIRNKNYVSVSSYKALPELASDTAQFFLDAGILSFVFLPLVYKEEIIGIIGLASGKDEIFWSGENLLLLKICSEVFVNVLENKKQASKIQEMNELLERRVTERTRQLEDLNEELESFSYSVSHDMRAPLRVIRSYLDIIGEDFKGKLPADMEVYLNSIQENADQMNKLIDNILSFSKITQTEIKVCEISVKEIVENAFQDLVVLEEPNRIINFDVENDISIVADSAMFRQAITNILSNALKYTRKNKTASIKVHSKIEDNEAIIVIEDNGIGFDMKYNQKIFGVFQRLHSEDEYEGDGVGLAFVQRIINKHRGRVWVESEEKSGTKFFVALPVNEKL